MSLKVCFNLRTATLAALVIFNIPCASPQKGIAAFGIQFKPIFPLALVNTDGGSHTDNDAFTRHQIDENAAYSAGAVLRFGITSRISLESGISYTKRNYRFRLTSPDFPGTESGLSFINYEIPLTGMVFVRLGEKMYMNASAGIIFNLCPTGGVVSYERDTIEFGIKESSWANMAFSANFGFEYRTEKNGYFYLGTMYHRPFSPLASVHVSYRVSGTNDFVEVIQPAPDVSGNYLSLDLRYFFHPGVKENVK